MGRPLVIATPVAGGLVLSAPPAAVSLAWCATLDIDMAARIPLSDMLVAQDLLSQVQDQVDILKAVEKAISDDGREEIVWRVTDVTKNSPITFEITPYPKTHGMDIQSRTNNVVAATAGGLQTLLIQGERPLHFTDAVLKKIENINKRVTNGLAGTLAGSTAGFSRLPGFGET